MNNYGGTVGRPIRKNKLFYFPVGKAWGAEELQQAGHRPHRRAARRKFQRIAGRRFMIPYRNLHGGRPHPVSGNIIPAERSQSPITLKMQALVPGSRICRDHFELLRFARRFSFNRDNVDEKISWTISEKNSLWTKYSAMKALVSDQFSLGAAGGVGMINGGGAGPGDVLMQVVTLGGVHTFTPNLLMDGTHRHQPRSADLIPPDAGSAFGLDTLRIPGTNGPEPDVQWHPRFSHQRIRADRHERNLSSQVHPQHLLHL